MLVIHYSSIFSYILFLHPSICNHMSISTYCYKNNCNPNGLYFTEIFNKFVDIYRFSNLHLSGVWQKCFTTMILTKLQKIWKGRWIYYKFHTARSYDLIISLRCQIFRYASCWLVSTLSQFINMIYFLHLSSSCNFACKYKYIQFSLEPPLHCKWINNSNFRFVELVGYAWSFQFYCQRLNFVINIFHQRETC